MADVQVFFEEGLMPRARAGRGRCRAVSGPDSAGRTEVLIFLPEPASLKDLVESLGVPHCEIGSVGGDPAALGDLVRGPCRAVLGPVRPFVLADPRFLCDGHLGRLAALLRLLGFDTLHDPRAPAAEVARRGINEGRTVLSRHLALLMRRDLDRAMLVRADDPFRQLAEVAARFALADRARFFGRCSACNGPIEPAAKARVLDRIPPRTAAWLDVYYECCGCGKLYWEGTHVPGLRARLRAALGGPDAEA